MLYVPEYPMEFITPFLNFGTTLLVAIVSAVLAVRLALRRFHAEKLWEKKLASYGAIMEAVHHVREHADTNLLFVLLNKDLPEEGDRELTTKLQAAMAELRKQRDIGSFVISEKAVAELNSLFVGLDASTKTNHWQEHLELKLKSIDKTLPELKRIAKKDLNFGSVA